MSDVPLRYTLQYYTTNQTVTFTSFVFYDKIKIDYYQGCNWGHMRAYGVCPGLDSVCPKLDSICPGLDSVCPIVYALRSFCNCNTAYYAHNKSTLCLCFTAWMNIYDNFTVFIISLSHKTLGNIDHLKALRFKSWEFFS